MCVDCGGRSRTPLCPACREVAERLGMEAEARLRLLGVVVLDGVDQ